MSWLVIKKRRGRVLHRVVVQGEVVIGPGGMRAADATYLTECGQRIPHENADIFLSMTNVTIPWCKGGCAKLGLIVPDLWRAIESAAWFGLWRENRYHDDEANLDVHVGAIHIEPEEKWNPVTQDNVPTGKHQATVHMGRVSITEAFADPLEAKAWALKLARLSLQTAFEAISHAQVVLDQEMEGKNSKVVIAAMLKEMKR